MRLGVHSVPNGPEAQKHVAAARGFSCLRPVRLVLFVAVWVLATSSAFAQTIHYSLAMPQPATHVFQVEATIDQPGMPSVDLALPAWNGLYQIRDFSQFVQNLHANVPFKRIDKNTWRFNTGNATQLKVTYGVFAGEWS